MFLQLCDIRSRSKRIASCAETGRRVPPGVLGTMTAPIDRAHTVGERRESDRVSIRYRRQGRGLGAFGVGNGTANGSSGSLRPFAKNDTVSTSTRPTTTPGI